MKQIKKLFLMSLLVLATMVFAIFAGGCGGNLSEKVDQLMCDHDYASLMPVVTIEPTCAEEGEQVYTCSKCNKEKKEDIPATGHAYVDVKELQAATCTAEGIMLCRCEKCGEMKQEPIAKEPHTVVTKEGKAATCEEDGYTEYSYCSACNKVYVPKTVLSKFGHIIVKDAKVAPTCTLPGKTEGNHCSRCGEVFLAQEAINPLNHSYVNEASTPATCTKAGWAGGNYCTRCGDVEREGYVIPMVAHNYSEVDGNCTECGKHQHTAKAVPAVAAKCTETGLTDGEICKFCGATLKAQETIPATGHTLNEQFICSICGEQHEHVEEYVARVEPTCTRFGREEGTQCSICKVILSGYEVIDLLPHQTTEENKRCTSCGLLAEGTDGVLYYELNSVQQYEVTGVVDTTVQSITIPEEFDGLRVECVLSLGDCQQLESIHTEGVIMFYTQSLKGCEKLREITANSSSISFFHEGAFDQFKGREITLRFVEFEDNCFYDSSTEDNYSPIKLVTIYDFFGFGSYNLNYCSATLRIENLSQGWIYLDPLTFEGFKGKISVALGLKEKFLEAMERYGVDSKYADLIVEEETVTLPQ